MNKTPEIISHAKESEEVDIEAIIRNKFSLLLNSPEMKRLNRGPVELNQATFILRRGKIELTYKLLIGGGISVYEGKRELKDARKDIYLEYLNRDIRLSLENGNYIIRMSPIPEIIDQVRERNAERDEAKSNRAYLRELREKESCSEVLVQFTHDNRQYIVKVDDNDYVTCYRVDNIPGRSIAKRHPAGFKIFDKLPSIKHFISFVREDKVKKRRFYRYLTI